MIVGWDRLMICNWMPEVFTETVIWVPTRPSGQTGRGSFKTCSSAVPYSISVTSQEISVCLFGLLYSYFSDILLDISSVKANASVHRSRDYRHIWHVPRNCKTLGSAAYMYCEGGPCQGTFFEQDGKAGTVFTTTFISQFPSRLITSPLIINNLTSWIRMVILRKFLLV